jgi:hypothetical protein
MFINAATLRMGFASFCIVSTTWDQEVSRRVCSTKERQLRDQGEEEIFILEGKSSM